MATTKGITALQRLILYELAASARWQAGRLIAHVTVANLADRLERGPSTVRAVVAALSSVGHIARSAGQNVAELDITPAALAAGLWAASPSTENPAGALQKSGGAELPIEIDSNKFNYINNLDLSARPSGFPAARFHELVDAIRRPEVRASLPHADDMEALIEALPAGDPAVWTPSDAARAILSVEAFGPSPVGPGVGAALIRSVCARVGPLALVLAIQALIAGKTPKALFIHMARSSSACDPDVAAWTVLRAVQAAARTRAAQLAQAPVAARPLPSPTAAAARVRTRLQREWDDAGGPPALTGEFARLAQRTLSPPSLPPLRNS